MDTRLVAAIALFAASLGSHAASDDPLVAHEWGTFTTVQGADGKQLLWQPLINTDLPRFVYSCDVHNGGFTKIVIGGSGKGQTSAVMRMETPVIYFYSQAERVVDVRVEFPNGTITEWYPQAAAVAPNYPKDPAATGNRTITLPQQPSIEWKGVQILSRDAPGIAAQQLIRDSADPRADHYYAARATDANFLRVTVNDTDAVEHERDLFYRGIGYGEAPLTVETDTAESTLSLSTRSKDPLTGVFVLTIRGNTMRYQRIERVATGVGATVMLDAHPFTSLSETRELIMQDVAAELERQELYAKEARAMVDTWKDQWFAEEGTRVLYMLPRGWTDKTLPLQIRPQPDRIVRVMVGRAEVITPTAERNLKQQILTYLDGDAATRKKTVKAVRELGLGRFLQPATQLAIGNQPSDALVASAFNLAMLASKPEATEQSAAARHP
jgi:hypothetical protein